MLLNKIGLYILAKASWITRPFTTLSLLLDGIVYTVVAYVYKIFILMAQMRFSKVYEILEPLIDRVKALIMVLVMFKLGKSLIEYMIDPAKATDKNVGGAALVKNLGFTAALLILYPFFFGVMNDISLLVIGSENGATYEYLGKLVDAGGGSDTGLLARFIWGSNVDMEQMDVGTWLAHETFTIFLHDMSSDGSGFSTETVDDALKGDNEGEFVFTKAHNLVDEIDITVEYTLPFVSTIMGLYLIYSIAKVAIEIGVRMFKMIILQILAPLAIITIIDKGVSSPTFKTFCKTYISVFLEAITRIAIVFIITTFVGAFMQDGALSDFFGEGATENVLTRGLICVIVLVAGYRVVGILPKFIDQALGTNMAGSASGSGFGKFAAGLVGGAIGLGTGLATGIAGGAGVLGTAGNMLSGAVGGFQSGGKGKNVADFFRNQSANTQASRDRAERIARQGGGLRYAGAKMEGALGIHKAQEAKAKRYENQQKAYEAVDQARIAAIEKQKGQNGIAYGNNVDDYVDRQMDRVYANDSTLMGYDIYEKNVRDNKNISEAEKVTAIQHINTERENRRNELKASREQGFRNAWQGAYQRATSSDITAANRNLGAVGGRAGRQAAQSGSISAIQGGRNTAKDNKEGITSSGSYQRGQRLNGK